MLYSEGGRRKLHRPENLNQRRFSKPFNPIEDAKRPSWVCAVGGAFQWVQAPPGKRSSRKQPEQSWR